MPEQLKHHRPHFRRNPNARVGDTELHASVGRVRIYADAALLGKLHRVAQQVLQHDLEFCPIAQVDPSNGVMYPALQPLQVGRTWGPRIYPRLMEMMRRLGAGGLMQLPASSAAFDSPIGQDLERYYRGARISAQEKVALFKLAWDLVGSDFGSRHTLYELYYAGDPSLLMAGFHREFKKEECLARVKELLAQTVCLTSKS